MDYLVINNILENKFGDENNKIKIINKMVNFESELVSKEEIASHILIILYVFANLEIILTTLIIFTVFIQST